MAQSLVETVSANLTTGAFQCDIARGGNPNETKGGMGGGFLAAAWNSYG